MSVPVRVIPCCFLVGKDGVANPIEHLWKQASPEVECLASSVEANRASCNRCKFEMEPGELFGRDLKTLACPNCYSDDLSVIEVKFELGWANL